MGNYRLIRELGRGAMGVVHLAEQISLRREVALKMMLNLTEVDRRRFEREMRTLIELSHPNIVKLYDCGELDGDPFLAMELIQGRDLLSVLSEERQLSPERVRGILRQVASALDYCHTRGILHRDVKIANMMQEESGRVVLMDFGLARGSTSAKLTATGKLVGTPIFMSPGRMTGEEPTAADDVWALGLCAWWMLTGKKPFAEAMSVAEIAAMVIGEGVPPLSGILSDLPQDVEQVVMSMVERDPARRPRAAEVVARLERGSRPGHRTHPTTSPVSRSPSSGRVISVTPFAVVVAAAIGAGVAGAWLVASRSPVPLPPPSPSASPPIASTGPAATTLSPAVLRDRCQELMARLGRLLGKARFGDDSRLRMLGGNQVLLNAGELRPELFAILKDLGELIDEAGAGLDPGEAWLDVLEVSLQALRVHHDLSFEAGDPGLRLPLARLARLVAGPSSGDFRRAFETVMRSEIETLGNSDETPRLLRAAAHEQAASILAGTGGDWPESLSGLCIRLRYLLRAAEMRKGASGRALLLGGCPSPEEIRSRERAGEVLEGLVRSIEARAEVEPGAVGALVQGIDSAADLGRCPDRLPASVGRHLEVADRAWPLLARASLSRLGVEEKTLEKTRAALLALGQATGRVMTNVTSPSAMDVHR